MNQRIGYARVLTDDQNLDLQLQALRPAGVVAIYEEAASGKVLLGQSLNSAEGRSGLGTPLSSSGWIGSGVACRTLCTSSLAWREKGVGFESITEKIETTSTAGKLVFHVFAALAEFERNLIRERTRTGLVTARARGRSGGRKPKLDTR